MVAASGWPARNSLLGRVTGQKIPRLSGIERQKLKDSTVLRACWGEDHAKFPVLREFGLANSLRSGGLQRLDPRQLAAFEPFEKGAAGGRDIAELVHHPGHRERRHRVAAARDAHE